MNMKALMILFLVLLASLYGCGSRSYTISNENLYSQEFDVSIKPPKGWQYIRCGIGEIGWGPNDTFSARIQKFYKRPYCSSAYKANNAGGFSIINPEISQIVFTVEKIPKMDGKDFSQAAELTHKKRRSAQPNNYKYVNRGMVNWESKKVYQFTYTFKHESGLSIKGVSYYINDIDFFYVLTYFAPKRYYYDKYLSKFEKLVKTFRKGKSPEIESSIEKSQPPFEVYEGF